MRPLSRVMREEVLAQSMNSTVSANRHMDAVGRERLVPLEQPRGGLPPKAWQPARSPSFLAVLQGKRHRYPPQRKHGQTRRLSDSSLDVLVRSRTFQHGEKLGPQASRSVTPELRSFHETRRRAQSSPVGSQPTRRRNRERDPLIETNIAEVVQPITTQPKAMRKSALTAKLVPLQSLQRQRKNVMTHDERVQWKAEMLAAKEEAFENRMESVWERAYRGALRQVQYISSMSTATKLPEIGQWHGLVRGSGIGNLKSKLVPLDNRPVSREVVRPLSHSLDDNAADNAPELTIVHSGQGALF